LFEHVQDYANHFMEKRLIFDPKVAQEIVTLIREHSEGLKCPFIDADAGLCLIARWLNLRKFFTFLAQICKKKVRDNNEHYPPKGQLRISKCPFGVIVWTKIPLKKFDKFLP
jgi:hypothetical protein